MRERLIKAAEEYLKYRLWEELEEDDVFAVRLGNGETGFVTVCGPGANGEKGLPESGHTTLELYRGDAAIESMLDAHVYTDVFDKSEFAGFEKYFAKDCLMMAAEEGGSPKFLRALPYRGRQEITDAEEEELLAEALMAATLIGTDGLPEDPEPQDEDPEEGDRVPLFKMNEEGFAFAGFTNLPEPVGSFGDLSAPNPKMAEAMKQLPQEGIWESEMIFLPEPKACPDGGPPRFDHMIMLVNNSTGASLVTEPVTDFRKSPNGAGVALIRLLELRKFRPEAIIARDDRTFELLEPVCRALDIDISQNETLPILDAVQEAILHQDRDAQQKAEEEFEKFIDSLCSMPEENFSLLPKEVLDEVKVLLEMGVITGEKAEIIKSRI